MLLPVLLALAQAGAIPESQALTDAIAAADAKLFRTYFEACDPAALGAMVTPDFEMYHDKAGRIFTTSAAFVADYARDCEAKKAPDAWRSRRALLPESLHVEPVPGYGDRGRRPCLP